MTPDQVSAGGSIAAAAIALVALAVSVYAAVIARRAAKAADTQALVATKSYRLAAQPKINIDLDVEMKLQGLIYTATINRRSGPFDMEIRSAHNSMVVLSDGSRIPKKPWDTIEPDQPWMNYSENKAREHFGLHVIPDDALGVVIAGLLVRIDYEIRERGASSEDWWKNTEFLEWQNPELEQP